MAKTEIANRIRQQWYFRLHQLPGREGPQVHPRHSCQRLVLSHASQAKSSRAVVPLLSWTGLNWAAPAGLGAFECSRRHKTVEAAKPRHLFHSHSHSHSHFSDPFSLPFDPFPAPVLLLNFQLPYILNRNNGSVSVPSCQIPTPPWNCICALATFPSYHARAERFAMRSRFHALQYPTAV